MSDQILQELLDQIKKETGVKQEIAVREIVDYRLLREVTEGIRLHLKPDRDRGHQ